MLLKQLSLVNFKNYEKVLLPFQRKVNCFAGPNGAGKTNLLDAIYYLCITKSYFNHLDLNNVNHQQGFFRLEGILDTDEQTHLIKCLLTRDRRKEFYLDDVKYEKLSEHVGAFPVVIITPDDGTLITGASDERRRFLDAFISQMDREYLKHLQNFNRLLQQRNAALKRFAEQRHFDATLIKTYDEEMAPAGQYIFEKRKAVLDEFKPLFTEFYKTISGDKEAVALEYDSELHEHSMAAIFVANHQEDSFARRTTGGIHRDDIMFTLNGHVVKRFGSQGQQKSFLISLILAQYQLLKQHKGVNPLLLLDDIFDKLDAQRCANLLQFITNDDFGQVFITDTHRERIEEIFKDKLSQIAIFEVSDAAIKIPSYEPV